MGRAGQSGELLFLEAEFESLLAPVGPGHPDLVVGDMGYLSLEIQRDIRERLGVGVLTRVAIGYEAGDPFEPGPVAVCSQGQPLKLAGVGAA